MSHLSPGTLLLDGKYRVIRVLGQGGFGITYEAEQTLMERRVCIKEFFVKAFCDRDNNTSHVTFGSAGNADIMNQYKAKFIKEAKTIAKLKHPGIIQIFDVFTENNTAYYVMEYVAGQSLYSLVRERGPLSTDKAIDYIKQVGDALSYAHGQHVMHLDVKPSNIMLDGVRAILIDFGLAKQYSETGEQTSSTPVGISPGYAPLEQYQDGGIKEFSPATDVYSLGATLYMLLTGKTPPQASTILENGIPIIEGVPAFINKAINKAMMPRRQERPQCVDDFLLLLNNSTPENEEETIIEKAIIPDEGKVDAEAFVKKTPSNVKGKDIGRIVVVLVITVLLVVGAGIAVAYLIWNRPGSSNVKDNGLKEQILLDSLDRTPGTILSPDRLGGIVGDCPKYSIIVGAFRTKALAEKRLKYFQDAGHPGMMVEFKNGLYAVAVYPSDDLDSTIKTLEVHRADGLFPNDSWILVRDAIVSTNSSPSIPTEETKVEYGSIKVTSIPDGATIFLDGKSINTKTPATIQTVEPGRHTIKLVLNWADNPEYSCDVTVVPDKQSVVRHTFQFKQEESGGIVSLRGAEGGHEWVDLGLSVKWATCNVGANRPSDTGDYFAWGETLSKDDYSWDTLKYCIDSNGECFSKYITNSNYGKVDNLTRLERIDDAAYANWGGHWRIPTKSEWEELKSNCKWIWTTQNGMNGYKVISNTNNNIFLPAAGERRHTYFLDTEGERGIYWSSSLSSNQMAWSMRFSLSEIGLLNYRVRMSGFSVRPVID